MSGALVNSPNVRKVAPVLTSSGDLKSTGPETAPVAGKYSRGTRHGFAMFQIQIAASSANIPFHCVGTDAVFPIVYVAASLANTATVYVGPEGTQLQDLNAGDVFPYFDLSPQDIWAYTTSASAQTVVITGTGNPGRA